MEVGQCTYINLKFLSGYELFLNLVYIIYKMYF